MSSYLPESAWTWSVANVITIFIVDCTRNDYIFAHARLNGNKLNWISRIHPNGNISSNQNVVSCQLVMDTRGRKVLGDSIDELDGPTTTRLSSPARRSMRKLPVT
ncbi:hypothetical protein L596_020706 [Steinernema carpocapsae]|uniref:Uncharacterized protein n=1 Tax=Steinernema carpocapsae TaxID=34508 RepID=A0A4U5MV40_STECR|nr:hypothetical protein L596_020706 [Steinernema carpocapsae]